jgi:hypothetical protein
VIVSGETPNPKPQTPGGIGDSLVNLKYAGKSRPSPILDWFIKADWGHDSTTHLYHASKFDISTEYACILSHRNL